jgi:hypothetical protein
VLAEKMMKNYLSIVIVGAVAFLLAHASYQTTRWGGSYGYNQLEYELTFKDATGRPVEGIELKVEDQRGKDFYCYPVTDYLPGRTPTSDKDGVMRFHHVGTAVEWDNYGWSLWWFIPIQSTRSPVYICRFLRGGKEVHRVAYGKLPDWDWPGGWEEVPKVKRRWDWSTMIPKEIRYSADDTLESEYSRLRRFFHVDGDEKPNREAAVACNNAMKLLLKLDVAGFNKQEPIVEIEFPVIRRTITVELPSDI